MIEKFRWLAAVIAAHPNRRVVGRTRLQKTINLLQRLKLPTNYSYTTYFYGPYSEGLHADIGLLKHYGLIDELEKTAQDGSTYYIISATPDSALPGEMAPFQPFIERMSQADAVVLELAATYDSFRAIGSNHDEATERLRRKKGKNAKVATRKRLWHCSVTSASRQLEPAQVHRRIAHGLSE